MYFPGPELGKDIFFYLGTRDREGCFMYGRGSRLQKDTYFANVLWPPLGKNIFLCPGTTAREGCLVQVLGPEFGKDILCITWSQR